MQTEFEKKKKKILLIRCVLTHRFWMKGIPNTTLAFTHFFLTSGQEDLTQTNLECFSCCLPGFSYITTAITEALQVVIVLNADV